MSTAVFTYWWSYGNSDIETHVTAIGLEPTTTILKCTSNIETVIVGC